jgi:hypothetical protein
MHPERELNLIEVESGHSDLCIAINRRHVRPRYL